jgi:hypothetical protein
LCNLSRYSLPLPKQRSLVPLSRDKLPLITAAPAVISFRFFAHSPPN